MSTMLLLDSSQTTSDSANFSMQYNPPIILDPGKHYEIRLISATIWHSMANVKLNFNDDFTFNFDIRSGNSGSGNSGNNSWVSVKIPQGAYNVTDLNKVIKELISKYTSGDSFELVPNYNTLLARITLKNNLMIDFSPATSIASLLGFQHRQYGSITERSVLYDSELLVNITQVNTILINCSIASGSYSALGSQCQTIYSFSPDVPPGSLMQIIPRQIRYYPIIPENQITNIMMQVTNQSGRQIDLNNEIVTYYLHLRAQ